MLKKEVSLSAMARPDIEGTRELMEPTELEPVGRILTMLDFDDAVGLEEGGWSGGGRVCRSF